MHEESAFHCWPSVFEGVSSASISAQVVKRSERRRVVETERRFYLCNAVDLKVRTEGGDVYYEVSMSDAWVWDMYRPARFVKSAKVLTFRDVSIEEIAHSDLEVPKPT